MRDFQTMPGYRTGEFRIALLPHQDLRRKIMQVREKFAQKYQIENIPRAAFLTLASFTILRMQEERLIQRLNHLSMSLRPFKVDIRDFGSYPDHSIFLSLANHAPVKELVSSIQQFRSLMKLGELKPHFLRDFNFLVAGRLKPWQYEKGWEEYQYKQFTGSFIAKEMVLLRKATAGGKFQVVQHLEFRDLPVAVTQGELF